jgi:hypothetical protein
MLAKFRAQQNLGSLTAQQSLGALPLRFVQGWGGASHEQQFFLLRFLFLLFCFCFFEQHKKFAPGARIKWMTIASKYSPAQRTYRWPKIFAAI